MAFSGSTMSVHYRWRPPEPICEQLRLAHELRQELASMRLAYEADLQAIWSSFPAVAVAEAAAVNNGPSLPAERHLWFESIAAVVQERNSDVRKIAELPTAKVAEILERLYDKGDSQRCADTDLHHREVRTIKQTADEVLARVTTTCSLDGAAAPGRHVGSGESS